jgi:hypothetical protein
MASFSVPAKQPSGRAARARSAVRGRNGALLDRLYPVFMLPGLAPAQWARARTRRAHRAWSAHRDARRVFGVRVAGAILGRSPGVAPVPSLAAPGVAVYRAGRALPDAAGCAPTLAGCRSRGPGREPRSSRCWAACR